MIRIGVVNIDVSHPKAFAEYLVKGMRARYVAVYNDGFRENDEVDAFIRNYNLERRCKSIEELAASVDIGFIQGCNWEKHLEQAMPFINIGKPVYIDKPIVGSLADCIALEKLSQNGAVILGGSSLRYAEEVVNFINKPEEERGKILNVFGTSGVDEFNYAIHIVEAISTITGTGAVSNRFVGRSEVDNKICDTYFICHTGGISSVYNAFQNTWQPFEIVIMTTNTTYQFRIDTNKIYGALLDRICSYIETGQNTLAKVTELTESIRIMLAGKISRNNGGKEVFLSDIPEDDHGYDGYQFAREYSANAKKIYL